MKHAAAGNSVLIITQSRSFAMLLESMLYGAGASVTTVIEDGDAACVWLRYNPVDIVLVDGDIGGGGPFNFATQLRMEKQITRRTVPMVLLSISGSPQVMRKSLETGYDGVLPKPVRAAVLAGEISRLMRQPRVYVQSPTGYCGPDRRRRVVDGLSGDDRRNGETFQVFTQDGPVSLSTLEKLEKSARSGGDMKVLLVRGCEVLSSYRLDHRASSRTLRT